MFFFISHPGIAALWITPKLSQNHNMGLSPGPYGTGSTVAVAITGKSTEVDEYSEYCVWNMETVERRSVRRKGEGHTVTPWPPLSQPPSILLLGGRICAASQMLVHTALE